MLVFSFDSDSYSLDLDSLNDPSLNSLLRLGDTRKAASLTIALTGGMGKPTKEEGGRAHA